MDISEFKERFIKEHRVVGKNGDIKPYSDETKRVVRILFEKIRNSENNYNKDVYAFDNTQFEEALKSLKATTVRSLQNSISTLEQYIDFALEKGQVSKEKGNIAAQYNTKHKISNLLDEKAEENMILTKSEVDSLSGYAQNAQDGVILCLLFDGVSYKRKFVELRNIRIQDCDINNMVINIPQLVDEDTGEVLSPRTVPISNHTKTMIESAMKEEKYVSLKGESKRNYKIASSDYILRGLRNNFQIKWENVSQRIIRIAELEGNEYLNATNISYSGQIHYARELMKEEGLSIVEACRRIIIRFNINDNESAYFYLKGRIEKNRGTF
ncbi:tyrosine-type recombinase/integrase [Viridibacillus sp. NPDC093762]|uniref:phage lytic cycle repressor MrpR family protein n=1 Tax=Viridibacillus sp. NPDC093762 TaxID=3390720 RepID=UPI003D058212